jgi:predicted lipoprotein with Yx(FWY)xxD motif
MGSEDATLRRSTVSTLLVVMGLTFAACSAGATTVPSSMPALTIGSTPATSTPPATPVPSVQVRATVGTATGALGTFLVGPDGKTLYLFEADKTSHSTCSGSCTLVWLPLITSGPAVAESGVKQSLLSTSQRADGTKQVVYNGHPLYSYVGDTKPGDTLGEGLNCFGAGWDVVSPAGTKI